MPVKSNFLSFSSLFKFLFFSSLHPNLFVIGIQFLNNEQFACPGTFSLRWDGDNAPYTVAIQRNSLVPKSTVNGGVGTGTKNNSNNTSFDFDLPGAGLDRFKSTVIDNTGSGATFALQILNSTDVNCGGSGVSTSTSENSSSPGTQTQTQLSTIATDHGSNSARPSSSSTSTDNNGSKNQKSKPIGAVVGGTLGGIALLVFSCFVLVCYLKRRHSRGPDSDIRRVDPFYGQASNTTVAAGSPPQAGGLVSPLNEKRSRRFTRASSSSGTTNHTQTTQNNSSRQSQNQNQTSPTSPNSTQSPHSPNQPNSPHSALADIQTHIELLRSQVENAVLSQAQNGPRRGHHSLPVVHDHPPEYSPV
ncbi:hypothetical protein VKT23_017761 [Stygiomarasmius scandens]|uniref:Mid2 domain-containing protein n=1 Tax=Marasmiellus scandens TaxID=2682957 RepID=A0ABR1IR57_9AGAR